MGHRGDVHQGDFSGDVEPTVVQQGDYPNNAAVPETGGFDRPSGHHGGVGDSSYGNSGTTVGAYRTDDSQAGTSTHVPGSGLNQGTQPYSDNSDVTSHGQHKATIGEKIKGNVEEVVGRITDDRERIEAGQQLKFGNHPSQSGNMYGAGRQGGV